MNSKLAKNILSPECECDKMQHSSATSASKSALKCGERDDSSATSATSATKSVLECDECEENKLNYIKLNYLVYFKIIIRKYYL